MKGVTYLVLDETPLTVVDTKVKQSVTIGEANLAIRVDDEVQIGADAIASPDADCWFALSIEIDDDAYTYLEYLVTDGTTYYLCRRSRGESKFILTKRMQQRINARIKALARRLRK